MMADDLELDVADNAKNSDGADAVRPFIENLVFRGGGVKGIAYCGALKVLSDLALLDNVKRYFHLLSSFNSTHLEIIIFTISVSSLNHFVLPCLMIIHSCNSRNKYLLI